MVRRKTHQEKEGAKAPVPLFPPIVLPLLAPLSLPMAEHLFAHFAAEKKRIFDDEALLLHFLEMVDMWRRAFYIYIDPFVRTNKVNRSDFSTQWLLRTLAKHSPGPLQGEIPSQTLSGWYQRGLLSYQDYGVPDLTSAAALLIARAIDTRRRYWLPSALAKSEPRFWCFRQDSPCARPVASPIPFPPLPRGTLLWTVWQGACWTREGWTLTDHGAIQLYGVQTSEDARNALAGWDAQLVALQPANAGPLLLEQQVTYSLHRLAHERFSGLSPTQLLHGEQPHDQQQQQNIPQKHLHPRSGKCRRNDSPD